MAQGPDNSTDRANKGPGPETLVEAFTTTSPLYLPTHLVV